MTTVTPAAILASPQFAREHGLRCGACHRLPPQLNEQGLAFQANGYRLPERLRDAASANPGTVPLAAWITGRYEDKGSGEVSDTLLPKVELISGGRLGEKWSYFLEWRIVSLSLNSDGSQNDRGGRFEDLFFEWGGEEHSFKIGQYRSLNQIDVSLRLSASEPLLFGNGLRTSDFSDPRLAGLSRFSPSSRSPSLGYSYQSRRGRTDGDGVFHHLTLPFTGELSIPLSNEASRNASFELAELKGVYAETFYRSGLKTLGGHVFFSDDSWLATALATYDWSDFLFTAGLGLDDQDSGESRTRASVEAEYLLRTGDKLRAAFGARIEDVSHDGRSAQLVPYVALAAPNTRYTFLLQLQYRDRDGSADDFVMDLSLLF